MLMEGQTRQNSVERKEMNKNEFRKMVQIPYRIFKMFWVFWATEAWQNKEKFSFQLQPKNCSRKQLSPMVNRKTFN